MEVKDMNLKELEDEITKARSWMQQAIQTYDSYNKIGFISQANKLHDLMNICHHKVRRMMEAYTEKVRYPDRKAKK